MNSETGSKGASNRWSAVLVLLLLLSLACLGGVLFSPVLAAQGGTRAVPVALQSKLRADYSADAFALAVPGVGIDLIGNAIQDQMASTDLPDRLSTLVSDLKTAVPTVTPHATQPAVREATPTRVVLPTRRATGTAPAAPAAPTDVPPEVPASPTATRILPTRTLTPTSVPPTQAPPPPVPPTSAPPVPTSQPYPPPPSPTDPPPQPTAPPPGPTDLPPQPTAPPPQPTDPPPYP